MKRGQLSALGFQNGQAVRPPTLQAAGQKLALEAAGILNDVLALPELHPESKQNRTPVTLADFLIQIRVMLTLAALYPADRFIGEEVFDENKISEIEGLLKRRHLFDKYANLLSEFKQNIFPRYREILFNINDPDPTPRLWINDPLDGTAGFINKNGQYACSLALLQWDGPTRSYSPVYGIIYAPHYRTLYQGEEINGPLVEAAEGRPLPGLYQTDPASRLEKVGDLDLKKTLEKFIPRGPITRDSKRFGPNPLDPFLEKYYPRETFVKHWGSSVVGMLEVILGNHALYSSAMSLWDFAAAAYVLSKAGGSPIRADNATPMERIDLDYLKTILEKGDRFYPLAATVGGIHAQNVMECLQRLNG